MSLASASIAVLSLTMVLVWPVWKRHSAIEMLSNAIVQASEPPAAADGYICVDKAIDQIKQVGCLEDGRNLLLDQFASGNEVIRGRASYAFHRLTLRRDSQSILGTIVLNSSGKSRLKVNDTVIEHVRIGQLVTLETTGDFSVSVAGWVRAMSASADDGPSYVGSGIREFFLSIETEGHLSAWESGTVVTLTLIK
jgi:hypothetical protein